MTILSIILEWRFWGLIVRIQEVFLRKTNGPGIVDSDSGTINHGVPPLVYPGVHLLLDIKGTSIHVCYTVFLGLLG